MSRMGKSSSLPASMSKMRTIFENGEKNPKFEVGPTSPRPGPILLRQEVTAVKLVTWPLFSGARSMIETTKTAM